MSAYTNRGQKKTEPINVFVRVRPLNRRETNALCDNCIEVANSKEVIVKQQPEKKYVFDGVFNSSATQLTVYETTVKPFISEILAGYNCTVFAYGQTGTGKTFTMAGGSACTAGVHWLDVEKAGIIPRALADVFDELTLIKQEYAVYVSYLEVYNEEFIDLLSNTVGGNNRISESKLTRLLQDSIGGRTKTSIIATISPATTSVDETLSTLDYVNRARNVNNRPEVNRHVLQKGLDSQYVTDKNNYRMITELQTCQAGLAKEVDVYRDIAEQLLKSTENQKQLVEEQWNRLRRAFNEMKLLKYYIALLEMTVEKEEDKHLAGPYAKSAAFTFQEQAQEPVYMKESSMFNEDRLWEKMQALYTSVMKNMEATMKLSAIVRDICLRIEEEGAHTMQVCYSHVADSLIEKQNIQKESYEISMGLLDIRNEVSAFDKQQKVTGVWVNEIINRCEGYKMQILKNCWNITQFPSSQRTFDTEIEYQVKLIGILLKKVKEILTAIANIPQKGSTNLDTIKEEIRVELAKLSKQSNPKVKSSDDAVQHIFESHQQMPESLNSSSDVDQSGSLPLTTIEYSLGRNGGVPDGDSSKHVISKKFEGAIALQSLFESNG